MDAYAQHGEFRRIQACFRELADSFGAMAESDGDPEKLDRMRKVQALALRGAALIEKRLA